LSALNRLTALRESEAWPAKLEVLLRQHGVNLSVSNPGINGNMADGMLSRADSAMPSGTRFVIFEPSGNDNKEHLVAVTQGISGQSSAGLARVASLLSSAGAESASDTPIARQAGSSWCGRLYQGVPAEDIEDSIIGRHPNPSGTTSLQSACCLAF
jgi:hypothetical protein